jgi:acetate CoA/acetoacetate CoA-transferase alpha subunit
MPTKLIKPVMSADEAVRNVSDGMSVMVGGFNYGGVPYTLVDSLVKSGVKDLHLIANDTLYANDKVPEGIGPRDARRERTGSERSRPRISDTTARRGGSSTKKTRTGNSLPRGRSWNASRRSDSGSAASSRRRVGTCYEDDKQVVEVDGKRYIVEKPLRA